MLQELDSYKVFGRTARDCIAKIRCAAPRALPLIGTSARELSRSARDLITQYYYLLFCCGAPGARKPRLSLQVLYSLLLLVVPARSELHCAPGARCAVRSCTALHTTHARTCHLRSTAQASSLFCFSPKTFLKIESYNHSLVCTSSARAQSLILKTENRHIQNCSMPVAKRPPVPYAAICLCRESA